MFLSNTARLSNAPNLRARVEAEDIRAAELVIGGSFASTETAKQVQEMGAAVFPGVRKAAKAAIARLQG